jgi:hypothetical protein
MEAGGDWVFARAAGRVRVSMCCMQTAGVGVLGRKVHGWFCACDVKTCSCLAGGMHMMCRVCAVATDAVLWCEDQ